MKYICIFCHLSKIAMYFKFFEALLSIIYRVNENFDSNNNNFHKINAIIINLWNIYLRIDELCLFYTHIIINISSTKHPDIHIEYYIYYLWYFSSFQTSKNYYFTYTFDLSLKNSVFLGNTMIEHILLKVLFYL